MTASYWTDFVVAGLCLYLFHSALIGRLETHRRGDGRSIITALRSSWIRLGLAICGIAFCVWVGIDQALTVRRALPFLTTASSRAVRLASQGLPSQDPSVGRYRRLLRSAARRLGSRTASGGLLPGASAQPPRCNWPSYVGGACPGVPSARHGLPGAIWDGSMSRGSRVAAPTTEERILTGTI
jgi:hypothetical protein